MSIENRKIHQRQIWIVITDSFMTTADYNNYKRPINILRGEKIEIRFPYEWHFRTEDNYYFHATKEMIYENCEYVGEIFEQVAFTNKATLEEIIRLRLYNS